MVKSYNEIHQNNVNIANFIWKQNTVKKENMILEHEMKKTDLWDPQQE